MNPAVIEAFALAIIGACGLRPPIRGVPGHEPDEAVRRKRRAAAVTAAMDELRKLAAARRLLRLGDRLFPAELAGRRSGATITRRLRAVKDKYDPEGLFFLHHGVGSEDWSADGFTRRT